MSIFLWRFRIIDWIFGDLLCQLWRRGLAKVDPPLTSIWQCIAGFQRLQLRHLDAQAPKLTRGKSITSKNRDSFSSCDLGAVSSNSENNAFVVGVTFPMTQMLWRVQWCIRCLFH